MSAVRTDFTGAGTIGEADDEPALDEAPRQPDSDAAEREGRENDVETFDVVVVGAGLSGIAAACYLRERCPWASVVLLEGRGSLGGTWDLFRYPGVRSDSDMFTLGYSFRPWDDGRSLADGGSIRRYIEETAREYGVLDLVRFHHRVVSASWSGEEALWRLSVETGATDQGGANRSAPTSPSITHMACRFLFLCTGYYRYDHGYLPSFEGIEDFAGPVVHPQAWPEDLDYEGKRVVVIGSGATAVTLVPALAERAAHVTMLQRSPTYIASLPSEDPIANLMKRALPDRLARPAVRWLKALLMEGTYRLSKKRPDLVRRMLRRQVERMLPEGYDVDTHFTPRYDPWDQRLCVVPDGDLFRSIRQGRVSVVTDQIERFSEKGILLGSGREIEADVVVTATGLELLFLGGIELTVDGKPVDASERLVYRGMMLEGVPNLAIAVGYTNASWTLKCELTCDYVTRLLDTMRKKAMLQCTPVNNDPSLERLPLLPLRSGYVLRAADRMPKQGSRFPWRVHQSYLRDYFDIKRARIEDGVLLLSRPAITGRARWGTPHEPARRARHLELDTNAGSLMGQAQRV